MTPEQIIGLALLAGVVALYWRDRRPAPPPPAAQPGPSGLADLMAKLDAPRGRKNTATLARELIEQHADNEEVGFLVIAVEPDSTTTHSVLSVEDKIQALAILLRDLANDPDTDMATLSQTRQCQRVFRFTKAS
jgi:hypothetical protein